MQSDIVKEENVNEKVRKKTSLCDIAGKNYEFGGMCSRQYNWIREFLMNEKIPAGINEKSFKISCQNYTLENDLVCVETNGGEKLIILPKFAARRVFTHLHESGNHLDFGCIFVLAARLFSYDGCKTTEADQMKNDIARVVFDCEICKNSEYIYKLSRSRAEPFVTIGLRLPTSKLFQKCESALLPPFNFGYNVRGHEIGFGQLQAAVFNEDPSRFAADRTLIGRVVKRKGLVREVPSQSVSNVVNVDLTGDVSDTEVEDHHRTTPFVKKQKRGPKAKVDSEKSPPPKRKYQGKRSATGDIPDTEVEDNQKTLVKKRKRGPKAKVVDVGFSEKLSPPKRKSQGKRSATGEFSGTEVENHEITTPLVKKRKRGPKAKINTTSNSGLRRTSTRRRQKSSARLFSDAAVCPIVPICPADISLFSADLLPHIEPVIKVRQNAVAMDRGADAAGADPALADLELVEAVAPDQVTFVNGGGNLEILRSGESAAVDCDSIHLSACGDLPSIYEDDAADVPVLFADGEPECDVLAYIVHETGIDATELISFDTTEVIPSAEACEDIRQDEPNSCGDMQQYDANYPIVDQQTVSAGGPQQQQYQDCNWQPIDGEQNVDPAYDARQWYTCDGRKSNPFISYLVNPDFYVQWETARFTMNGAEVDEGEVLLRLKKISTQAS